MNQDAHHKLPEHLNEPGQSHRIELPNLRIPSQHNSFEDSLQGVHPHETGHRSPGKVIAFIQYPIL